MLEPEPLPYSLLQKLLAAGVTRFTLEFSGGNDEGYLDVDFECPPNNWPDDTLVEQVESWAWEAFSYPGDGDGNDYGDILTYNLLTKTVERSEWDMVRQDTQLKPTTFSIDHDIPGPT